MKTYKTTIGNLKIIAEPTNFEKTKIISSLTAVNYARQFYESDISIYESMFCLFLNRSNSVQQYAKISQGGTAGTVVDIKIILKYAIDTLSSGIILIHNHPSGNKQPSDADIEITNKLKNACKYHDLKLLDHIILTENNYYSLADEGNL